MLITVRHDLSHEQKSLNQPLKLLVTNVSLQGPVCPLNWLTVFRLYLICDSFSSITMFLSQMNWKTVPQLRACNRETAVSKAWRVHLFRVAGNTV